MRTNHRWTTYFISLSLFPGCEGFFLHVLSPWQLILRNDTFSLLWSGPYEHVSSQISVTEIGYKWFRLQSWFLSACLQRSSECETVTWMWRENSRARPWASTRHIFHYLKHISVMPEVYKVFTYSHYLVKALWFPKRELKMCRQVTLFFWRFEFFHLWHQATWVTRF